MRIEYFYTETKAAIPKDQSDNWLFIMNDGVYKDNYLSCESQSATVDLDTFCEKVDNISWRVIEARS